MEKQQIMTIEQLVDYNNEVRGTAMKLGEMVTRLNENAVEIASGYLSKMQNIADIGRDVLISQYISVWAREAEKAWLDEWKKTEGYNLAYYDFIDEFAEKKFQEFKAIFQPFEEPQKEAKLVVFTLTTRVVVDKNPQFPEAEEEDAINFAISKIKRHIDDYLNMGNFECCETDVEVPYDPETDKEANN